MYVFVKGKLSATANHNSLIPVASMLRKAYFAVEATVVLGRGRRYTYIHEYVFSIQTRKTFNLSLRKQIL